MIEFTPDGPFGNKLDGLFPSRVRVIGLGLTGTAVCDQLVLHGKLNQDLWVIDSDQHTIDGSIVANRHMVGRDLTRGLGCSGDLLMAREIVVAEKEYLSKLTKGSDFLILIVGLSGATGVAIAEYVAQRARSEECKIIIMAVQPFTCEGIQRRQQASQNLALLRSQAECVMVLSLDRLSDVPTVRKNIRNGFHLMHQQLAKATEAIAQVVSKRGLIQLSFADLRSLYGRYAGAEVLENCWISHVEGSIQDDAKNLIDELLSGPLLQDKAIWQHADHAIVTVSGSHELGLSDVQELILLLRERLPLQTPIATSAFLEESISQQVRVTLLLAKTAPDESVYREVPLPQKEKPLVPPLVKLVPQTETVFKSKKPVVEEPLPSQKSWKLPVEEWSDQPKEEIPPAVQEISKVEEPLAEPELVPAAEKKSKRHIARQEEIQFEPVSRGRFEKSHETIYRGENLDQPTFRRRRLSIRL